MWAALQGEMKRSGIACLLLERRPAGLRLFFSYADYQLFQFQVGDYGCMVRQFCPHGAMQDFG